MSRLQPMQSFSEHLHGLELGADKCINSWMPRDICSQKVLWLGRSEVFLPAVHRGRIEKGERK